MRSQDEELKVNPMACYAYPVFTEPNIHYRLHAHRNHELVLVQHGRFRSQVCGEEYVAVAGDILLYTAHTPHEDWAEGDNTVMTWACGFEWNGFGPDEPVYRRDTDGNVQHLAEQLTGWYLRGLNVEPELQHPEGSRLLRALLVELERLAPFKKNALVDKVRAFISSKISEPLTLDDLAAVACMSKYHFIRQYKALTGRTPMDDVKSLRVEEARRLIVTTNLPLHKIAPQVGITNEYHLSRLLKDHLGVGVRELRQHSRE